ncbi:MAG TPA: energy-coupling factor transporter transmembrane component T, partial [Herpetosiphonaceae bacterium]|nr:energy-coupling factor transporter transmembrane component T [Herpetosiphonaceae bacterium]
DAQASRGIRLDGLYLLRNGPVLLAPLLVSALQFADSLAEALEARGFGSPRRTLLRDYRFCAHDWALVTGMLVAVALWVGWSLHR